MVLRKLLGFVPFHIQNSYAIKMESKFNVPVWICNILDQLIKMKSSGFKTKKKNTNAIGLLTRRYFYVTHNQSLLCEWNIYHNSNQLQMSWIQNMEKIIIC